MLMNLLATVVLFLFIGPFDYVSSRETKTSDSITLQVNSSQLVFVAVNNSLELNCTISRHARNLHPTQLLWKHNKRWRPYASYVLDNYTVQLKIPHTRFKDAGLYRCGVYYNSSQFQNTTSQDVTVVVGEKPVRPLSINIKNVFGKPVQQLTVWWPAKVNLTYELFVGRIPMKGQFLCTYNKTAISTQTLQGRNQNGFLSYDVKRKVLGQLFQWSELSEINVNCGSGHSRCDAFCAYVIVKNAFGTSHRNGNWNLLHRVKCPTPDNLTVVVKEQSITVKWHRPHLVWKHYEAYVYYSLAQNITPVLTGKKLPPVNLSFLKPETVSFIIEDPEPYTTYGFSVSCCLDPTCMTGPGPVAYIEVTSKEKAPSEAPSCKVRNRTIHGQPFLSLKLPPKAAWNGRPRRLYVNGEQQIAVNVSLDELHEDRPVEVGLRDLDPHKNYSLSVTMCTGGGCGENVNQCFINAVTDDSVFTAAAGTKKPPSHTYDDVVKWTAIATGLFCGLTLSFAFIAYSIKLQRSRRKKQTPLAKLLADVSPPNNSLHIYVNDSDDRPSVCEESSNYDFIATTPLLKDVDCTVGNCHVSKL